MDSFVAGGWLGKGPGEGTFKRILPDAHTDFIFAVTGEEFGLIFCMVLAGIFAFVVLRGPAAGHAQRGSVLPLRRGRPGDAVRHPELHQHGGEPAADAGQGHDAALHLLRRLVA